MKIGVDLDNVTAETMECFLDYFNKEKGTCYKIKDMINYDIHRNFGISQEEEFKMLGNFFNSRISLQILPVKDSVKGIKELNKSNEIYVITGRPEEWKEFTREWLDIHFRGLYKEVYFSNCQSKHEICIRENIELMIEDNPVFVRDFSNGIHVILYERPWTCNVNSRFHKVKDWEEAVEKIKEIENGIY